VTRAGLRIEIRYALEAGPSARRHDAPVEAVSRDRFNLIIVHDYELEPFFYGTGVASVKPVTAKDRDDIKSRSEQPVDKELAFGNKYAFIPEVALADLRKCLKYFFLHH
jgi:hypothetical protein